MTPLLAGVLAVVAAVAWNSWFQPDSRGAEPRRTTPPSVYFGPPNSVAVLPFEVIESSPRNAFWGAGFSSEFTRLLMLSPGLRVTSHNSSLYFRDRPDSSRLIAERLQVNYLLSGSFRIAGEKLTLALELYSARRDRQTWSRVYELDRSQLSSFRSRILADTTKAMNVGRKSAGIEIEAAEAEAWIAYIRGLYHRELRTPAGFIEAETAFREAIGFDPEFALARVGLATSLVARDAIGDPAPGLLENARLELAGVLQANPGQPEALALASYISRNYDWRWTDALEMAEQAIRELPGDPELMSIAALAMFSLGQFDRAIDLMDKTVRQDPLNLAARLRLGLLQEFSTDYEAALASYRLVLEMNPGFPGVRAFRARVKVIQQKPDSALKESEQETDIFWKRYASILVLTAMDKADEAAALLEQMIAEDADHAAYQVAELLAFHGDLDGAFNWLERSLQQRDGGIKELLGNYFLNPLHDDPRWNELLARMKLPLDLDS